MFVTTHQFHPYYQIDKFFLVFRKMENENKIKKKIPTFEEIFLQFVSFNDKLQWEIHVLKVKNEPNATYILSVFI